MKGRDDFLNIIFFSVHHFYLSFEVFDFCLEDSLTSRRLRIDLSNTLFVHRDLFELMIPLALISRMKGFEFIDKVRELITQDSGCLCPLCEECESISTKERFTPAAF